MQMVIDLNCVKHNALAVHALAVGHAEAASRVASSALPKKRDHQGTTTNNGSLLSRGRERKKKQKRIAIFAFSTHVEKYARFIDP